MEEIDISEKTIFGPEFLKIRYLTNYATNNPP